MSSISDRGGPTIPTERVGVAVDLLRDGQRLTTRQVAELIGISREGTRQMLNKLSRFLPIRYDYDGQVWIYERRS